MKRVIAVCNYKGGVGKTAICMNLGAALHRLGKAVLLVDLDPQAALTYHALGKDAEDVGYSMFDLLIGSVPVRDAAIEIEPGFDLVPADFDLMSIESVKGQDKPGLLRDALRSVRGVDYILIDTPPAINIFTVMAIMASSSVYVVVNADMFSYRAMMAIEDVIESLASRAGMGIVVNLFDQRRNIEKEIFDDLKARYGGQVFKTAIRRNVAIPEGVLFGRDIFRHRKASPVAEDFIALGRQVIKKEREGK